MDSISKKYGDYKYFSFLEEKDLDKLKDISIKKTYKKDEILFYKGDESMYLYLLVSGIVKLYTHDFKDNEVVIHNLIGPALIAEIMNYEEMDFLANCSFDTDAEVILIDYKKFKEEFLQKPEISIFFIKSLTKKIKFLQNFIDYNVSLNSMEKLQNFYMKMRNFLKNSKTGKNSSNIKYYSETFSRQLAKLKKRNIIENEKGYIKILDYKKIQNFISN